jgi:hypothetical protein
MFRSLNVDPVVSEWEVVPGRPNLGVGDQVFRYNGVTYIVESKYLSNGEGHTQREQRRQGRRVVMEQAERYADHWRRLHPSETVKAYICNGDACKGPIKIDVK